MKQLLAVVYTFSILSVSTLTYGQNAYYHSIELAKYVSPITNQFSPRTPQDKDTIKSILNHYGYLTGGSTSNPIIDPLIAPGSLSAAGGATENIFNVKSLSGSIGGLNVTNLADGLAKFLVERSKQELNIAFFDKFKGELNKYEEIRILFPRTRDMLNLIGDEIYNISAYTNMLREGFEEDLKNIIPNLRNLIDSDVLTKYLDLNSTVKFILINGLLIAEELQNGNHPGDIISGIGERNPSDVPIKNFSPTIKVLDIFSQSLRSKQNEKYWISADSLKLLFKDKITFKIYLGLIWQRSENIDFEDNTGAISSFRSILGSIYADYDANEAEVVSYLKNLMLKAERVDQSLKTIKELNNQQGSKSNYSEHYDFYQASISLLKQGLEITKIPLIRDNFTIDLTKANNFFEISNALGDLYLDVREKNYFSAAINLNLVLEKSVKKYGGDIDKVRNQLETIQKALEGAQASDFTDFKNEVGNLVGLSVDFDLSNSASLLSLNNRVSALTSTNFDVGKEEVVKGLEALVSGISKTNKLIENLPQILKYSNLAASIVKAQSSDEVKQVIESVALPAGSASIKKNTKFNIALNSYVGLSWGEENLRNVPDGMGNDNAIFGITAPTGVNFSWGGQKSASSFSVLLNVIDVGALVSYRFQSSKEIMIQDEDNPGTMEMAKAEIEELPEIKLKNIFAPGGYIIWGLPKWPVSLGAGGQLGPQLRQISITPTDEPAPTLELESSAWRWQIFFAVDIPLINFYTKSR